MKMIMLDSNLFLKLLNVECVAVTTESRGHKERIVNAGAAEKETEFQLRLLASAVDSLSSVAVAV